MPLDQVPAPPPKVPLDQVAAPSPKVPLGQVPAGQVPHSIPTDVILGSVQIVKVDPMPVARGQLFDLIVRLTSFSSQPLTVSLAQNTQAMPTATSLTLGPKEQKVVAVRARLSAAGPFRATATASWQTSLTVTKVLPSGQIVRDPVYKRLGEDSVDLNVLDAPPASMSFIDLSPDDLVDGSGNPITASGVVDAMAGTQEALFAIPKTAGVWRSINGQRWQYLKGSPPRAFSIAIDPQNSSHIAVGERADDNSVARLGRSGLWESSDFGNSWVYTYDPTPDADTQGISSVAFSNKSSALFILTNHGVARRDRSQTANPFAGSFQYSVLNKNCSGPTSLAGVTALTVSETKVWARSDANIFYSTDDGKTFACQAFPPSVFLPSAPTSFSNVVPTFNTTSAGANDDASIGAFDDRAFVIFNANTTVPRDDPRATEDPRCDPSDTVRNIPGFNACVFSRSPLLIFDPGRTGPAAWTAQFTGDRDGRGLNGRRFVQAFPINAFKCPAFADRSIGIGRQIIYGSGQGIQQASGVDSSGRITWDPVILTSAGSFPGAQPTSVHPDMWNALIPRDFCPPAKRTVFMSTDGGIYAGQSADGKASLSGAAWTLRSDGLHVQTVQSLFMSLGSTVPPPTPGKSALPIRTIAYPTQDNDGWFRDALGHWKIASVHGDANYVLGDLAQPGALIWRRLNVDGDGQSRAWATLVGADGSLTSIMLGRNQPFDGPTRIQAIQSLPGEVQPEGALDVVMLVSLPLINSNGVAVADPPGGTGSGSRLALIRNTRFDLKPDGPSEGFASWKIEMDQLPTDTRRFWASGGHFRPNYFFYTGNSNTACPDGIQVRRISVVTRTFVWSCLIRNLQGIPVGNDFVPSRGPAFVNPYDPKMLLVASTSPSGNGVIKLSINGGRDFCDLPALTALLTQSGRYPVTGVFDPDTVFKKLGSRFHGYPFSVPSSVSFDRAWPGRLAIVSPYTGVFVGSFSPPGQKVVGTCKDPGWSEPVWRDLNDAQPTSMSYISDAMIIGTSVVVATEGRGIFELPNVRVAPSASYFDPVAQANPTGSIATLRSGNGAFLSWGRVLVTVIPYGGRDPLINQVQVRSDGNGNVTLPSTIPPGSYVTQLQFLGDGVSAPSIAKFALRITP
ncbi:hypothetical protein [Sphingomonas agri]|uniref:hypothetical protein n=1 Tax=Sphingomonas agri TaxID=1813878 RepID=UPI00311E2551